MKITEVNLDDKRRIKQFLELPVRIYQGDPNWIRPLNKDIETVFDPRKNKFWKHGKAIRWILLDDQGTCIGRVAAFVNERTAHTEDQPTGGMGFFECIRDQKAANLLLDTCKKWLSENGMEAMDGPINFGDRNAWWGLLVKGFHEPVYQMNYNPPYYQELLENYGFRLYFEQYVMYRAVQAPLQQRFIDKFEALTQSDPNYSFRHAKRKELTKLADDLLHVYNNAWGGHDNFKKMKREQAQKLTKALKPILMDELAWFGYYKDEPIAFFISIPDLNQVIKGFNGKFGWWQKLQTIYKVRTRKLDKCYGILFGIVPEHQGKGVDGGILYAAGTKLHPQNHWQDMELVWIGDFNPKMLRMVENLDAKYHKTYWTMRYLFDRSKPYARLPLMEELKAREEGYEIEEGRRIDS